MNRDQLRLALGHAVERHARTLQDQGGRAGPALLDDLEHVADKHAAEHAEIVTARRELRAEAASPVLVAASTEAAATLTTDPPRSTGGATAAEVTMTPQSSARTRTRPRRSTG